MNAVQKLPPNYGEVQISDGFATCRQHASIARQGPSDGAPPHVTGILPDGTVLGWSQTRWARLANLRAATPPVTRPSDDVMAPWRWDAASGRYVTYVARPGQAGTDLGIVEFDPASQRVHVVGKPLLQFTGPGYRPIGVTGKWKVWVAHEGKRFELIEVDASTGRATRHAWKQAFSVLPGNMALSPRGDKVAFVGFQPAPVRVGMLANALAGMGMKPTPSELVAVCRTDGTLARVVAREAQDRAATNALVSIDLCRWSPDGKRVAFQSRRLHSCIVFSAPVPE